MLLAMLRSKLCLAAITHDDVAVSLDHYVIMGRCRNAFLGLEHREEREMPLRMPEACKPVCPEPICPPPQVCVPVPVYPEPKCPPPQVQCKPVQQCQQDKTCVKK
ncbi:unnamed protein product [Ranitomeya imitator]|uniref:Uncharacterized protein n=1 Tax=Ranitomeya imitator TaxID=111125 RepID=A0ABN9KR17_9NEOB|nr:unnamed protein product [Ranitomeya imitator]